MPYVSPMTFRAIPALLALFVSASIADAAPTKPVPAQSSATKPVAAKAAPAQGAKTAAKPAPTPPLTVESLLAQAKDAITKGDTDLAVRLAQAAIVQNPALPSSYVALGNIYASAGQPDFARNFYDAALGIDPADAGAQKALSDLNRDHPETTARASQ